MSLMGEGGVVGFEEYDDDAYYLELRRRILLLMVDDDEKEEGGDLELERNYGQSWNRCSTGFPTAIHHLGPIQFEDGLVCPRKELWESEKTRSHGVPSWMVNSWRNSNGSTGNGTGVFIPQVVKPRRRQRQGRKMKSSGRRMHQQVWKEGSRCI